MKMHKIKNVEKSICTCEQKIAYNYAFSWRTQLEKIYKSNEAQFIKSEEYQQIINYVIEGLKRNGTDKKYNMDAIIHCFRNGIENYLNGYSIITNYEEIGKTFSCLYDIE